MELSVSTALKRTGEQLPFSLTQRFADQQLGGRTVAFNGPITLEGIFSYDGKSLLVKGEASVTLCSVCDRCAESFLEPFRFAFEETFVKASEYDSDTEAYLFSGDILCLDEALLNDLFLSLPIESVCKPDCKGICPVCGTNRNVSDCGCIMPDVGNPFSVLQASFRNDD